MFLQKSSILSGLVCECESKSDGDDDGDGDGDGDGDLSIGHRIDKPGGGTILMNR